MSTTHTLHLHTERASGQLKEEEEDLQARTEAEEEENEAQGGARSRRHWGDTHTERGGKEV